MSELEQFEYPALYVTADSASAEAQSQTLNLIRFEYGALFIAAVLSVINSGGSVLYLAYALVFLCSLAVLLMRLIQKPQQAWYRARALAESIKTSSWRYCMRAVPFEDAENREIARGEFRNHLSEILRTNAFLGEKLSPAGATGAQITRTMEYIRGLDFESRRDYYDVFRIQNQRRWYAKKARENKGKARFWGWIAILAYSLAIVLALSRLVWPSQTFWPIEPLIVFASSIIGWTQLKKYSELASSYTLTAHEIGILQTHLTSIEEKNFSSFVNEAEQAFSREHTQWVARHQTL